MRITNKMIASRMLATITRNRALSAKLQIDIATTKKVRRPSDDPTGVVQLQRMKSLISRNEQYVRNITLMRDFMTNSSAALEGASEHLQQAKDIAIQASSGTMNSDGRKALSKQVDQIIDLMVDVGNTKYKNRNLFAGTLTTGVEPYSRSGDTITYNGNAQNMDAQIGFKMQLTYNKTGDQVFNPAGGIDVFSELVALKNGLNSDDVNAIQNSVTNLNKAIDQTVAASAEFGVLQDRLTSTEELINNENINYADTISRIQDTDMVKTLVDSQIVSNAITSGLKTMADVVQRSLVDFVS